MELLLIGVIAGWLLKPSKSNGGGVRSVNASEHPKPPPPPRQPK